VHLYEAKFRIVIKLDTQNKIYKRTMHIMIQKSCVILKKHNAYHDSKRLCYIEETCTHVHAN
jgi:hypothetical protein